MISESAASHFPLLLWPLPFLARRVWAADALRSAHADRAILDPTPMPAHRSLPPVSFLLLSLSSACGPQGKTPDEIGRSHEHPTAAEEPAPAPPTATSASAAAPTLAATASAAASDTPAAKQPAPLSFGPETSGSPPAGVPAPLYAALFELKKTWKISGERKHSHYDGKPVNTKSKVSATCTVASVERRTWGAWSTVSCKDLPAAGSTNLLEGHWFATDRGLFHLTELGSAGTVLGDDALVLPAIPKAEEATKKDAEMEGFFSKREVHQEKGAWCFNLTFAGGDEGWHGVCIDEKRGFVSGNYGWAGGSSDEVTFTAK